LLTWSWVAANRSRKNVDLPDAGKPIRITHSIARAGRSALKADPTDDAHLTMTFEEWVAALEKRHLANLRLPELARALRALSSAYVERRHTVGRGGPLDSTGKRAAFALFYAPLHFMTATEVMRALDGAVTPPPSSVLDIGCGTGAAGAAWAVACDGVPRVTGIDRHPWAVDEARWTYRMLELKGSARQGDVARLPRLDRGSAAIAAYVLNELPPEVRAGVLDALRAAAERGVRVLILEPVARAVAPWWDAVAERAVKAGGRTDHWRLRANLPPLLQTLDKAAGLDHRELTVRSIWLPGRAA
jgi:SAM-dependent methyltransferase